MYEPHSNGYTPKLSWLFCLSSLALHFCSCSLRHHASVTQHQSSDQRSINTSRWAYSWAACQPVLLASAIGISMCHHYFVEPHDAAFPQRATRDWSKFPVHLLLSITAKCTTGFLRIRENSYRPCGSILWIFSASVELESLKEDSLIHSGVHFLPYFCPLFSVSVPHTRSRGSPAF